MNIKIHAIKSSIAPHFPAGIDVKVLKVGAVRPLTFELKYRGRQENLGAFTTLIQKHIKWLILSILTALQTTV